MKKYVWSATLVFSLVMMGCGYLKDYADIVRYKGISTEYRDILETWTRQKTVHAEFETKVHISATYKSRDFMTAYRKEYARVYNEHLDGNDETDETKNTADNNAYQEFFFYAYVPDKDANDFDLRRSIWKVYLINAAGEKIDPVEIRRIKKITPVIEAFYPYLNKYYGNFYQLIFPNDNNIIRKDVKVDYQHIKLVFTSVLGKVELSWN